MASGGGENEVVVEFGAKIDDLKDKLGQVGGMFKELTERFAALAAVLAGGAAFKAFIDSANEANAAAEKMSRTLGITGSEAGVIAQAIREAGAELGVTSANADTYTQAFLKFNRMLRTNSESMQALGVDVKGLESGQKSSNQVFQEALKIVLQYKPGVDQTQVAMQLFGRSVADVQVLAKAMGIDTEALRKKMESLNLMITAEGVAAAKAYRVSMDGVDSVLKGLEKTVGEAVMPLFTKMAESLAASGPTLVAAMQAGAETFVAVWNTLADTISAVLEPLGDLLSEVGKAFGETFGGENLTGLQVFRNALAIIQTAFIALRTGVKEWANVVKTELEVLRAGVVNFGSLVGEIFTMKKDLPAIKAAWEALVNDNATILKEGIRRAVVIAAEGREDMLKALDPGSAAPKAPAGGPEGDGTKTHHIVDKGAIQRAAAQAAALNALDKARVEADLSLQKEYFADAQALYDEQYKNNLISTEEYYDKKLEITQAGLNAERAAKLEELADVQARIQAEKDPTQKLKFQAQEATLQGAINVLMLKSTEAVYANAAAYTAAEQQKQDALAKTATAVEKSTAESGIAEERANLDQLTQLRKISADDAVAIELDLQQRSYAIVQKALAEKQLLVRNDVQKQADLDAEVLAAKIDNAAKLAAIERKAAVQSAQLATQAQASVQTGFATMINGLLSGVTKLSDVFRNFAMSIANTFTNLIAQRFAERLFGAGTAGGGMIDALTKPMLTAVDKIVKGFAAGQVANTAAAEAGAAAQSAAAVAGATVRETADVGASAVSVSATGTSALANIASKAWEAAASVYAAVAEIPYVGWILAPVMAAAAVATVLGFAKSVVSSAGGEERVASDRLNIVHKDETILPRPYAEGLRRLISDGNAKLQLPLGMPAYAASPAYSGGGGGGATGGMQQGVGGGSTVVHIHTMDAVGVRDFVTRHGDTFFDAVKGRLKDNRR